MERITETVAMEVCGDIGVLAVDNPPVNALGASVRKGLYDGIEKAAQDAGVKAVVIICMGRTFFAGADIREFGKPIEPPMLGQVLERIERCEKPVVAAIHGTALGGGLETALACHFRVADPGARLGLPEVKLGLIPGAGGTQRLPRLVGPEKALEMITFGTQVGAREALEMGLVDMLAEGDLKDEALGFASQLVRQKAEPRRVSEMDGKVAAARGKPEIFADFKASVARRLRGFEAPQACIKAVEAAVNMPFEQGIRYERELFEKLMASPQSAAQRYYFFAEREAAKVPGIGKDTPALEIRSAAVIGAGTMGGGIAMNFANAGIPVTVVEVSREALERGLGVVRKNYSISASKGRLTAREVEQRLSLIRGTVSLEDAADADIVIEAVFEDMALKKDLFSRLDAVCRKGAVLATNTSYLDVNEIASATSRPEFVLGLHFFSPANVMRLLEIVRAAKTSDTVLATSLALAKRIGKIAVVVGVCHGFAGNRMFAARSREADRLILEGASIEQVDRVIYEFGFPMGPFVLRDLIGLDIGWKRETSRSSTIREILCEMGRLGQKSGAGYYRYEEGSRTPVSDPEVERVILEFCERQGIRRRKVTDEEILQRCLYPIVNEGAKILEEGIAIRASDLDVIWVNGYGWPVYLGGPMFWADNVGLGVILEGIREFQKRFGDEWRPAALLERLAADGGSFRDFDEEVRRDSTR